MFDLDDSRRYHQAAGVQAWAFDRWMVMRHRYHREFTAWYAGAPDRCHTVQAPDVPGLWTEMLVVDPELWRVIPVSTCPAAPGRPPALIPSAWGCLTGWQVSRGRGYSAARALAARVLNLAGLPIASPSHTRRPTGVGDGRSAPVADLPAGGTHPHMP